MFRRFAPGLVRVAPVFAALLVFGQGGDLDARQAAAPTAKEVIARHVKAMGGEAAFKQVKSIRARGVFSMAAQNISGEFEMVAERPNKLLLKVTVPGFGSIESGFDGKVGWTIEPVSGPALTTGRQLAELKDDAYFDAPLHGPDHVKDATLMGTETFDNRKATKMKVVFLSGNEQVEYFDVESGLQIGFEASRETPMGVVPTTGFFRNYQKFQNVLMPATLVQRGLGIEQVLQVNSYDFNTVPAGAFDMPPSIKALIK